MKGSRNLSGCQVFQEGNVPADWACVPLGERIALAYGRGLREEDRKAGNVDVYGSNGKVGKHDVALVCGEGILVGRKGTVGAVRLAPRPFWPIDTVYYVVPRLTDNLRYLYHLLCHLPLPLLNAATGVPGLSRRDAYALRGVFPSPDEQVAIARILDAVDACVERTRETVQRARAVGRSLTASLLRCGIDGDGRVRDRKAKPEKFVRTAAGMLPSTWRHSSVGIEFDLQNGFTLNEGRRNGGRKRQYLRVANVQRDALILDDVNELDAGDVEFELRRLELNDLLVVEGHADRLQIGRCAHVTEHAVGMTFQNHLFRLRTYGDVSSAFGCLWLNSEYAQRYWNARCATSSGLNTINQRMLKRMRIPVVPPEEQDAIVRLAGAAKTKVAALVSKEALLRDLKRALMDDLLSGRKRVDVARVGGKA